MLYEPHREQQDAVQPVESEICGKSELIWCPRTHARGQLSILAHGQWVLSKPVGAVSAAHASTNAGTALLHRSQALHPQLHPEELSLVEKNYITVRWIFHLGDHDIGRQNMIII